jgi:hypothetical protein
MFQLTQEEKDKVVANCDHLKKLKYSPFLPYVFTEHGTGYHKLSSIQSKYKTAEESLKSWAYEV